MHYDVTALTVHYKATSYPQILTVIYPIPNHFFSLIDKFRKDIIDKICKSDELFNEIANIYEEEIILRLISYICNNLTYYLILLFI